MNEQEAHEILKDVILEIQGYKSKREVGIGQTPQEYIEQGLMKMLEFFELEEDEDIAELQNRRNKLNRQIATLKKANLKKGEFLDPHCPHDNCSDNRIYKQEGKWFCSECDDYITPVEKDSEEHKKAVGKMKARYEANQKKKPCSKCNQKITGESKYLEVGICKSCMDKIEKENLKEEFVMLKDLEHDKKGDIIQLRPDTEQTKKLIADKIIELKN